MVKLSRGVFWLYAFFSALGERLFAVTVQTSRAILVWVTLNTDYEMTVTFTVVDHRSPIINGLKGGSSLHSLCFVFPRHGWLPLL